MFSVIYQCFMLNTLNVPVHFLLTLLLITPDSCSMCHVGAAVCGTWIYPSNRSYQWKHLKVQSLSLFIFLPFILGYMAFSHIA